MTNNIKAFEEELRKEKQKRNEAIIDKNILSEKIFKARIAIQTYNAIKFPDAKNNKEDSEEYIFLRYLNNLLY